MGERQCVSRVGHARPGKARQARLAAASSPHPFIQTLRAVEAARGGARRLRCGAVVRRGVGARRRLAKALHNTRGAGRAGRGKSSSISISAAPSPSPPPPYFILLAEISRLSHPRPRAAPARPRVPSSPPPGMRRALLLRPAMLCRRHPSAARRALSGKNVPISDLFGSIRVHSGSFGSIRIYSGPFVCIRVHSGTGQFDEQRRRSPSWTRGVSHFAEAS